MSSSRERAKHPGSADRSANPESEELSVPIVGPVPPEATAAAEGDESPVAAPIQTPAETPAAGVASAALTPGEIGTLQAKAAKADEHWDRLLRARADLENYKKRTTRERQDAVRFANLGLIEKLIPVLDSLEMALAAAHTTNGNSLDSLKRGLALVQTQLKTTLTEAGLEEIDAARQPFDPKVHEAVSQQDSADVPEGHVLQQLRKGYKLHERLIRPASVVVARKPGG